jgi:hypothetical protein
VEVGVKERSGVGSMFRGSKFDIIDDEIGESVARERE